MRFLLDECLSERLADLLNKAGFDVVHVRNLGLIGHVDDEVLEAPRSSGRVLVSADTDFGELLARSGATLPSLILFRQTDRRAQHQADTLMAHLTEISDDMDVGAIVVFTDDRLRIRRLPVR